MPDAKPPNPKADELAKQLKTTLAQRRPNAARPVLILLAVSTLLLALLAWWLYPRPRAGMLQVLALDAIFTPEDEPYACVQLFAMPPDDEGRDLSGRDVLFPEKPDPIRSDAKGQVSLPWTIPAKQPMTEFVVQHIDIAQRQASPFDRGRIFVWPKDARLLLIDADETLTPAQLDAKSGGTLKKAAADGWHIVYLALAAGKADEFRKTRSAIENQPALPKGPVLGRPVYPDGQAVEAARRELLRTVQTQFKGPLVAVVATAESAQTCKDAGVRTIVIGEAPAVAWTDVPEQLK